MVKFWNSCISEWEGWLTLHKRSGSRSFMTMTMTILVTKVRCMDLPDRDRGDFSCRRAVDSSSFFPVPPCAHLSWIIYFLMMTLLLTQLLVLVLLLNKTLKAVMVRSRRLKRWLIARQAWSYVFLAPNFWLALYVRNSMIEKHYVLTDCFIFLCDDRIYSYLYSHRMPLYLPVLIYITGYVCTTSMLGYFGTVCILQRMLLLKMIK